MNEIECDPSPIRWLSIRLEILDAYYNIRHSEELCEVKLVNLK